MVLTCQWHRRDGEPLARRISAPIYVPRPNPQDNDDPVGGHRYGPGDRLPGGLEALRGLDDTDIVLWSDHHRAVIAGDALIDRGHGLVVPSDWAAQRGGADEIKRALEPLLRRDVEVVLPTHGLPTDRGALLRALTQP